MRREISPERATLLRKLKTVAYLKERICGSMYFFVNVTIKLRTLWKASLKA